MEKRKGVGVVPKRDTTTKDISLLQQLFEDGQLTLAPEFQRESVWPRPAKAYLIDTILNNRPIPLLFFQRGINPQTNRPRYSVVDGQQRLRAIFEYLDDSFPLPQDTDERFAERRFSELPNRYRQRILNYDLSVVELSGYGIEDVKDIFVRINKYVVKLSRQELRHARSEGAFKTIVAQIAQWSFWRENKVFTPRQRQRMVDVEFIAELIILLTEGPQDKKASVDLYYGQYSKRFPWKTEVLAALKEFTSWVEETLPDLKSSRFRRPVHLYGLIGALDELLAMDEFHDIDQEFAAKVLNRFERELRTEHRGRRANLYMAAASRQTDNLIPRETRIDVLRDVLLGP